MSNSDPHSHPQRVTADDLARLRAMHDDELDDLMGDCAAEPADFEGCLACAAYGIMQDREDAADVEVTGDWEAIARQLAEDVLSLAEDAGVPDSYKYTDQRLIRAIGVLR